MANAELQDMADQLTKDLLEKFGGVATYNVVISSKLDQNTGDTIAGSTTPHTISAYQTKATDSELSSGRILDTQKVFLMYANSIPSTPIIPDTLIMNGITLRVAKVIGTSGGQTDVLYRLVCD